MSTGDDHRYGVPPLPDDYGGTGQTRTRLPDRAGPARGPAPRRPSRGLVVIGAVVALLIAAIAFANQNTDDSPTHPGTTTPAQGAAPAPTTPTGDKPAQTPNASGVPAGYPRTKAGAESAAANYTVALGSDGMYVTDRRHAILDSLYTKSAATKKKGPLDQAYSQDILGRVGLEPDGSAPEGQTFVSRSVPVGTRSTAYTDSASTVEVWYMALIGLAGTDTTHPVTTTWQTMVLDLQWVDGDWKIVKDSQRNGPTPVPGDDRASASDEISKAIEGYGGFTYAR
ncbi:hypothetical protein [Streptomyces sp. NRRL F-5630]|uniref:hypothetical protein n=1 Tax=Streptomyces sp. NRRL F-5630 TaxID=1463864 RepID=UPI003EC04F14